MREFQSKKVGGVGDASPVEKKWGDAVPPRPCPTTPLKQNTPVQFGACELAAVADVVSLYC